ncbi:hypothetical protein PM082_023404 [Marasmius tenuissimus]|nr:hypothetical protein PM082_023404 [Marasmius tenuissimus]
MYFSLRLPDRDRSRLRAAFLSQSLPLYNACDDAYNHVYIDEIGFSLAGTFSQDPTTYPAPVYLFISPKMAFETINGMHCVRLPFRPDTSLLFYWSFDPKGIRPIPEEDWERHGIPKLATRVRAGSSPITFGLNSDFRWLRILRNQVRWQSTNEARLNG